MSSSKSLDALSLSLSLSLCLFLYLCVFVFLSLSLSLSIFRSLCLSLRCLVRLSVMPDWPGELVV